TFSLHAQRESNQRENAPRHPGLIALGRSDFPRSGAAPGAGRDGPSVARLCLAQPSWPLTPSATPPLGLLSGPGSPRCLSVLLWLARCFASFASCRSD